MHSAGLGLGCVPTSVLLPTGTQASFRREPGGGLWTAAALEGEGGRVQGRSPRLAVYLRAVNTSVLTLLSGHAAGSAERAADSQQLF